MTGPGGGKRPQSGGLWPLAPAARCAGSLLATGLAAAGAWAWGGLGLVLATLAPGA